MNEKVTNPPSLSVVQNPTIGTESNMSVDGSISNSLDSKN